MIPPDIAKTMREELTILRGQYKVNTSPVLNRETEVAFFWNKIDRIDAALAYLDTLPAAPAPLVGPNRAAV